MKPVTARASTVAVSAARLPPEESSWRVRTRLDTVEPWVMALLSSWRKLSLSGCPSTTDTGKSPAGTSGAGKAPGGATGATGVWMVLTCSIQYHEAPVTGTDVLSAAGAQAGNRHVARTSVPSANTAQRRVNRAISAPPARGPRTKPT